MKAGYLGGGVAQGKVAEMEQAGVGEGRLLASQSVREKEGEDNWFSQESLNIVFLKWCDSRLRLLFWTSLCQWDIVLAPDPLGFVSDTQ